MGHPARRRSKPPTKSKPLVTSDKRTTVGAIKSTSTKCVDEKGVLVDERAASEPKVKVQDPQPAPPIPHVTRPAPLSPHLLDLTDAEWDSLFYMAVRHHFEQEQVWVPSVLRTMPLLEGINDRTGRPCRIYIRPNKRVLVVETLA